jgi:hypothetical protein
LAADPNAAPAELLFTKARIPALPDGREANATGVWDTEPLNAPVVAEIDPIVLKLPVTLDSSATIEGVVEVAVPLSQVHPYPAVFSIKFLRPQVVT